MHNVDTLTVGIKLYECYYKINLEKYLNLNLKLEYNKDINSLCYKGKYKEYSFYYIVRYYYLLVTLQNNIIEEYSHEEIITNTKKIIMQYFKIPNIYLQRISLNRIDYKTDYYCKNEEEKLIVDDILKIMPDKIGKSYSKNIIKTRYIDFISKGSNKKEDKKYKGSGYFSLTTYDKENERFDNKDIKGAEKYKNIIRTEVKIKNKKLNSNKCTTGITKELENYYDVEMAKMYFDYYVPKIFFTEPFYRIDIAIEKINKTSFQRNSMKTKLIELLTDIQKNGYTNTKEKYKCEDTFRSHIKKIRSMKINPLTFNIKYKTKIMDNFSLLENDVSKK